MKPRELLKLSRIPRIRMRTAPGSQPGSLKSDEKSPKPRVSVIAYGPDHCSEEKVTDPAQLDALTGDSPVVWINVEGLGDVDLLRSIGERFDIHRLALEDVCHTHQRSKAEPYERQLFVVARMPRQTQQVDTEQISIFVGDGYVLTFQEHYDDCFDLVRKRLQSEQSTIRKSDSSYLMYALLDAAVDAYFPVLERMGDKIEELEQEVLTRPGSDLVPRIHEVKRELLVLRRATWPLRDLFSALQREDTPFVGERARRYLRDVADHSIQLLDLVESYRELSSGLLDMHLSFVSNRMNEVMKVLTIFAAIFIPLTFVAGLYGMNFDSMPELHWRYGYPTALTVMGVLGATLLWFFYRKGWIGPGK